MCQVNLPTWYIGSFKPKTLEALLLQKGLFALLFLHAEVKIPLGDPSFLPGVENSPYCWTLVLVLQ
jgi:hypothetical protein